MHHKVILAVIGSFAAATIAVLLVGESRLSDNASQNANVQNVATAARNSQQAVNEASVERELQLRKQAQPAKFQVNRKQVRKPHQAKKENRIEQSNSELSNEQIAIAGTDAIREKPAQPSGATHAPEGASPDTGSPLETVETDVATLQPDAPVVARENDDTRQLDRTTSKQNETPLNSDAGMTLPHPESQRPPRYSPKLAMAEDSEDSRFGTSSFRISSSQTQAQFVQNGGPAGAGGSSTDGGKSAEEAETLGVPPPEEKPAFLRERSILLPPGQYQFEYGVRYGVDASTFPVAGVLQTDSNQVQIANANQKRRLLTTPLELRFGVSENLQAFLSIPLGWSSQSLSVGNVQQDDDNIGIGDFGIGLTRVLWAPKKKNRRILGFVQTSAPTGDSNIALTQQAREASLGAGYWTLTSGLNITETYDPLVLFSSVGYTYTFATTLNNGEKLNAGNTLFYQTGIGYSINPNITISASFSGASTGRAELNGLVSGGTRTEPFTLRLAGTISEPKKKGKPKLSRTREPFLRFGLTSLANDVEFGMRWTY
ncbi:MAG: hypothetical protein CMM07_13610 [Rhodopirellula sp.]|nr:hypothetical protein [Rhodopirellula sp.]